jgi:hypothetical protein
MLATYIATSIDNNVMEAAYFKVMALNNMALLVKNMSFKTIVNQ